MWTKMYDGNSVKDLSAAAVSIDAAQLLQGKEKP